MCYSCEEDIETNEDGVCEECEEFIESLQHQKRIYYS